MDRKPKDYHEAERIILGKLINIDEETKLLAEIKDVVDELNIIQTIGQKELIASEEISVADEARHRIGRIMTEKWRETKKLREHAEEHAENVHQAVSTYYCLMQFADAVPYQLIALLDLRQRHAHVLEAQSARKQADISGMQQEVRAHPSFRRKY